MANKYTILSKSLGCLKADSTKIPVLLELDPHLLQVAEETEYNTYKCHLKVVDYRRAKETAGAIAFERIHSRFCRLLFWDESEEYQQRKV